MMTRDGYKYICTLPSEEIKLNENERTPKTSAEELADKYVKSISEINIRNNNKCVYAASIFFLQK